MLHISEIKTFKTIAQLEVDNVKGGVLYFITEGNNITWSISSKELVIEALQKEKALPHTSASVRAMKERKTISDRMPRDVYGTRIKVTSIPIQNDSAEVIGAATIVYPMLHPMVATFSTFAPILSEMFPEGVFLYTTDLRNILTRQPSKKFDISSAVVGYKLQETDIASRTIKAKNFQIDEVDASVYGIPVLVMNYPLYDEEHPEEVVGTFGIILPKSVSAKLRGMSNNLEGGLSNISSTIEQLNTSAMVMQTNAEELDREIKDIYFLSDKINEISIFIKTISDSTNMLGLNAAIESARAGEHGRGFNVVAKEIRRLSEQTKSTVPQIKELTEQIKNKVNSTLEKSNESLESNQEQTAAAEEISASIEELTSLAVELNKISQQV